MAEKFLVPVYLPRWLHQPIRSVKQAFVPPTATSAPAINIWGERAVEWSFLSREMPRGPGEAIEFGCEQGYLSLLAAESGFHVIANDLQHQTFAWVHRNVEFRQGDFLRAEFAENSFDLAINCSSVEHVGVAGRYGIEVDQDDGDIDVMNRLAQILKPGGLLLMTAPCGRDSVLKPWCRVYGSKRLPRLFTAFSVAKQEYWIKNQTNQWERCAAEKALSFEPRNHPSDGHACAYALGCFVLRKSP
jgi:SAM-dependent methyltransferase